MPPATACGLALGATVGALGALMLIAGGDVAGWRRWVGIAAAAGQAVLAIGWWTLFIRRRRG
ncbi:hypothetical protein ABJI51_06675 [Amycolatopsis sp. NEAU-NG30]|uniref:Uncharacterized protein n=1 Tax=Amycolatopsis melonis TaxID=3156488 RepID=A0ABV0L8X9_9PSEU